MDVPESQIALIGNNLTIWWAKCFVLASFSSILWSKLKWKKQQAFWYLQCTTFKTYAKKESDKNVTFVCQILNVRISFSIQTADRIFFSEQITFAIRMDEHFLKLILEPTILMVGKTFIKKCNLSRMMHSHANLYCNSEKRDVHVIKHKDWVGHWVNTIDCQDNMRTKPYEMFRMDYRL